MLDLYPQEISNYDLHMSDKNDTHVSLKKLRDHEGVTRVVSEDSIAKWVTINGKIFCSVRE